MTLDMSGGGTLSVREDGLRVYLEARREPDGLGLYKVWLTGQGGGRFLLGTLAPGGGGAAAAAEPVPDPAGDGGLLARDRGGEQAGLLLWPDGRLVLPELPGADAARPGFEGAGPGVHVVPPGERGLSAGCPGAPGLPHAPSGGGLPGPGGAGGGATPLCVGFCM